MARIIRSIADLLVADDDDRQWADDALCAETDPDLFFPEKGENSTAAKRLCRKCPVITDCLEHALTHNERFGVWGGMSERDRRPLSRERGAS